MLAAPPADLLPRRFAVSPAHRQQAPAPPPAARDDLVFFNGLGGFTPDGREYIITTAPDTVTPAPWVNVLANPGFGTVVSESGSAYTWSENAHEFRLTPWDNDPVTDACGEAFYLRDEESGRFWSPTPLPARGDTPYTCRHGFGYSVFEHGEDGIASELWIYVDTTAPVKWSVLKIRNASGRSRRLSVTGYVEWVLGDLRGKAAPHVITSVDPGTGAVLAENAYNTEFAGRTVFFHVDDASRRVSGDRTEFIGRNGTLGQPAAMTRTTLSGRVGGALDPCAAIQVAFELRDGEERQLVFRLGAASADEAAAVLRSGIGSAAARAALEAVWGYWNHTLGAVHVETPDAALNMLANGWLLYQTLASRVWGRSGAYQSGGAFGFRDQLQDTMALVHAEPPLAPRAPAALRVAAVPRGRRAALVASAGGPRRPHALLGRLPLAAARHVPLRARHRRHGRARRTGSIPRGPRRERRGGFLLRPARAPPIREPSLYDHCVRAIVNGLRFGAHGLPLMGSGDWNDGMNLVGAQGRGESVWLGFFLYDVLMPFADLAREHGDSAFADRCRSEAAALRQRLEEHGWDGEWYRRAYFDDGSPLGSSRNPECQIDSIAQSWAVLSGAAEPARAPIGDGRRRRTARPPGRRAHPAARSAVRHVGARPRATSRVTSRACARTADSTPTRRSGRPWRLPHSATPGAPGSCGMLHQPDPPRRDAQRRSPRYKVEPYVVAADVYGVAPHVGRGGWTWYTGSAALDVPADRRVAAWRDD